MKTITEEKALKKLDIPDFRHITKDKVIHFASMLDKMDPEVAKKAIEQFPDFASTAKEMLIDYKEILMNTLDSQQKNDERYYEISNSIICSLQNELDKENLSPEDRRYIIDQMLTLHREIGQKDSESKKFHLCAIGSVTAFIAASVVTLASVLGSNSRLEE